MAKAYVVALLKITDPEAMGPYMAAVEKPVTDHGGSYLVRGGALHYTEGNPNPVAVVLEFPNSDAAIAWKSSDAYQEILPFRLDNSEGPLVICDGI